MPAPIESAFQKVVENAREWCPCCRTIRDFPKGKEAWEKVYVHICHATIETAAEFGDELLDSINCICDGQDDKNAARVTINRLREEAKGCSA